MAKTQYYILIICLNVLSLSVYSQRFTPGGNRGVSLRNCNYNHDISKALYSNNIRKMKALLAESSYNVNCASYVDNKTQYSRLSSNKIPLVYDAIGEYLNEKISFDMLKLIFEYKPKLGYLVHKKTFVYHLIDYLDDNQERRMRIDKIVQLLNDVDYYNLNKRVTGLVPPLSYLLTKVKSLQTFPDKFVMLFLSKGASINTNSKENNSILLLATKNGMNKLFDYCLKNNADVSFFNPEGYDAFHYIVRNNNIVQLKRLLQERFYITEQQLIKSKIPEVIDKADSEMKSLMFDKVKEGRKNLSDIVLLSELFPLKFKYFLGKGYRQNKYDLKRSDIPKFLKLFSKLTFSSESNVLDNITKLKKEYLFSSPNVKEFAKANRKYPFFNLNSYRKDYFEDKNYAEKLKQNIIAINDIPSDLKTRLLNDIERQNQNYFNEMFNNGSIEDLFLLSKSFPSEATEIENKAYRKYIKVVYLSFNESVYSPKEILKERYNINAKLKNVAYFIKFFNNSKYKEQAKIKYDKGSATMRLLAEKYKEAKEREERERLARGKLLAGLKSAFTVLSGNADYSPKYSSLNNSSSRATVEFVVNRGLFVDPFDKDYFSYKFTDNDGYTIDEGDYSNSGLYVSSHYSKASSYPLTLSITYKLEKDVKHAEFKIYRAGTYMVSIY